MAFASHIDYQLATAFNDAYNTRDARRLSELYAADVLGVWHVGPAPLRYNTRDEVIAHWAREWEGWPDATFYCRHVLIDGDRAANQNVWSATNTGVIVTPDGTSVPPTGKHVELECAMFMSFVGRHIIVFDNYWDNMLTFIQLGLLPGPT